MSTSAAGKAILSCGPLRGEFFDLSTFQMKRHLIQAGNWAAAGVNIAVNVITPGCCVYWTVHRLLRRSAIVHLSKLKARYLLSLDT